MSQRPSPTSFFGYLKWSIIVTVAGLLLGGLLGWQSTGTVSGMLTVFFICVVLAVLEISLSFDNAIVNANKLKEMTKHTHKINDLENAADDLLRDGLRTLFTTCSDPIEIMKKKEIYTMMESFSDFCEDVADILEGIIMRNS